MPTGRGDFHRALHMLLPFYLGEVGVGETRCDGFKLCGGLRRNDINAVQVIDDFG